MATIVVNFELMAVAIHFGVADTAVAFDMHPTPVIGVHWAFEDYIELRRKNERYPNVYEHLTRMAEEWSEPSKQPARFYKRHRIRSMEIWYHSHELTLRYTNPRIRESQNERTTRRHR